MPNYWDSGLGAPLSLLALLDSTVSRCRSVRNPAVPDVDRSSLLRHGTRGVRAVCAAWGEQEHSAPLPLREASRRVDPVYRPSREADCCVESAVRKSMDLDADAAWTAVLPRKANQRHGGSVRPAYLTRAAGP
jgi:hypothetical protein